MTDAELLRTIADALTGPERDLRTAGVSSGYTLGQIGLLRQKATELELLSAIHQED